MRTFCIHCVERLKNSRTADLLLNKYIFWIIFSVLVLPSVKRTDPLLDRIVLAGFAPLLNIVIYVFFSIITVKLIGKYASGNRERLLAVLMTVCISFILNADTMLIGDSAGICLLYFALGLLLLRGDSILIPLLIFIGILICPVLLVPLIPFGVYFLIYPAEKKVRLTVIACMIFAVLALVCHAALNGGAGSLLRPFTMESGRIFRLISDISKTGIVLIIFSLLILQYSSVKKPLKYTLLVSVGCTMMVYLIGQKYNGVLFAYLMIQSLILLYIFRRSVYRCVKNVKALRAFFMMTAFLIVLGQLLCTFDFDNRFFGSTAFRITPFYVCYQDFGFIQRGVFGTIFRLLFGTYIPENTFFGAYFISYFLLKLLFFVLIAGTVRYAKSGEERLTAMLLVFIFLISPGADKFYFEMFGYIMAWTSVLLACRNGHSMFLIPVCCLLAMLTHQVFASIIFPVVFIAVIYRALIDSQGHTVRNTVILTLTVLSVAVSFFYLSFFNAKNITFTYEQVCDMINQISGGFFEPHEDLVKHVYLDSANEHTGVFSQLIQSSQVIRFGYVLTVNSPALAVYIYAFAHSAKMSDSKIKKFGYIISALSVLAILPVFITETDYGRWCSQYISVLILAPLILTVFQTENNKWYRDIGKKEFYAVMALVTLTELIQPNFEQLLYYYDLRFF